MTSVHSVLLWIIILLASHTAAETYWTTTHFNNNGVVDKLLMRDIANCMVAGCHNSDRSMVDMSKNIRQCFRKHLYHCVKSKIQNKAKENRTHVVLFDRNAHCGKIVLHPVAAVGRGLENNILIRGTNGFIIHLNMLVFDFEWCSLGCRSHGMGIIDSADNNIVWFCGRRIPWTLVLIGDEVQIRIQLVDGKYKNAMFFYSKLKVNWVEYYTAHIHNHPAGQLSLHSLLPISHVDVFHIKYYSMYVITVPMQVIHFYGSALKSGVDIAFYDGPGYLSNKIYLRHKYGITTSGFCAFIRVGVSFNENITLKLQTKELKRVTHVTCDFGRNRTLRASATKHAGFVCLGIVKTRDPGLRFFINIFQFVGATMLDSSGDLDDCQYGGIFIKIQQRTVSICNYRYQHGIEVGPELIIMILWYRGYSVGYIEGIVQVSYCKVMHLDIKPSVKQISITEMIMDTADRCWRIICPSLNYGRQFCNITFKMRNRIIGVAKVTLTSQNTLHACVGHNDYYNKIYEMSAVFSNEWPFTQIEQYKKSKPIHQGQTDFLHLHQLNISIPYVCQKDRPYYQLGVVLQRTTCTVHAIKKLPINSALTFGNTKVYEMTKECMLIDYTVELEKNTTILYLETQTRHTGVRISVAYNSKCPKDCQNYTYALKVWNRLENATRLNNVSVGETLFTDYFYDSFRLEIIPPPRPCDMSTGCAIKALLLPPVYPIGTRNSRSFLNGDQLIKIYQKR